MRFLLVDAHSVIFAWPELRELHRRNMEAARSQLIQRLTAYQDATGTRVVAVFDGQGKRGSQEHPKGGIQIFYSKSKSTADQVIERLVAKYAGVHDMTVATDDLLEQQTAITFGGLAISTGALAKMLEESEANVAREIRRLRKQ